MQQFDCSVKTLGIMGGTFDPIHLGHLRAAEEIAEAFDLDRVVFIPAANPPHKSPHPMVGFEHRYTMLKLALADRPGFFASDIEQRLSKPSFTINTIKAIQDSFGHNVRFYFLVGLDSFMTISSWYNYEELLNMSSFVVFGRAGIGETFDSLFQMLKNNIDPNIVWDSEQSSFISSKMSKIYFLPGGRLEISSSYLRQRLEAGGSVRYLVPETVRLYINSHGLYKSGRIL